MFNTNVGEMPIDIFGDYVSDCLGEEWSWEYLPFIINANNPGFDIGDGDSTEDNGYKIDWGGISTGDGYGNNYGCGKDIYHPYHPYNAFGDGDGIGMNRET